MEPLSKREMQVAELLAWGLSDKQIAEELYISFDTTRTHRRNIYQKLSINNVADLTRWYFESTGNYNFGLRPKIRITITILFLILTLIMEFENLNAIRVRTSRVQTTRVSRVRKGKRKETFQYA